MFSEEAASDGVGSEYDETTSRKMKHKIKTHEIRREDLFIYEESNKKKRMTIMKKVNLNIETKEEGLMFDSTSPSHGNNIGVQEIQEEEK